MRSTLHVIIARKADAFTCGLQAALASKGRLIPLPADQTAVACPPRAALTDALNALGSEAPAGTNRVVGASLATDGISST
jgi:hypothetical protein